VLTKYECLALARMLARHPLRGRKRPEADVWCEAAREWAAVPYQRSPQVQQKLGHYADLLTALRRYREPQRTGPIVWKDLAALVAYFGGFFSGEGSFAVSAIARSARIVIKLRRDDRPLLETFATTFGIGSVVDVKTVPPAAPAAVWNVTRRNDLFWGVQLLDAAGLRGRKRRQYRAWRPAALELATAGAEQRGPRRDILIEARSSLAAATAYTGPSTGWVREDRQQAARQAYRSILREWAETHPGDLTCTAYMRARKERPWWPNRDTIARMFGSWRAALVAADLTK
jgi:hypothetical protein